MPASLAKWRLTEMAEQALDDAFAEDLKERDEFRETYE